jgi:hypothetical protein
MEPVAPGTHVIITNAEPWDDVSRGEELIVRHVDPSDNTFRGEDVKTGKLSGWIHWRQAVPTNSTIGWDFLETVLPPETVELLSAFDGLKQLTLKPEIATRIIRVLPDIENLIRLAVRVPSFGAVLARPIRPSRFTRGGSPAADLSEVFGPFEKSGRTTPPAPIEPRNPAPADNAASNASEAGRLSDSARNESATLSDEALAAVEDLSAHLRELALAEGPVRPVNLSYSAPR